jgi:hypothetical protein
MLDYQQPSDALLSANKTGGVPLLGDDRDDS